MAEPTEDFVKSVINFPKKMLLLVNIYPGRQNNFTKFTFGVMLTSVAFIEIAQLIYMSNTNDITEIASTCTTISTNFQAICKLLILYYNFSKISHLLLTCYKDFWSVNISNEKLQISLRRAARLVNVNMVAVLSNGIMFAFMFLFAPLWAEKKQLPFAATLPFEYEKSPVFEVTYCWQVITNMFCVLVPICGHDFLFIALMLNIIVQFRLLKYSFKFIGDSNSLSYIHVLKKENSKLKITSDRYLLKICIEHHIMLINFCDVMETVFSSTVFIQYVASISAICVSSFLISLIEKSSVFHLVCFCIGHVFQLFMYCAAGNELTYQSSEVANAVFHCKWYESDDLYLKKNLLLVIQRSQREKKITAMGFVDLNYESFIKVLKLSFSFNALLNSINEK